jgi:hypothetical protein
MSGKFICVCVAALLTLLIGCERNFDIDIDQGNPMLVVEAYINNELPLYNYVILTRSQDYYSPNFEGTPVSGATVTITEGELLPDRTYKWDATTRKPLREASLPQLQGSRLPGVYFDTMLASDPSRALMGKPGKYYLLEITEGKHNYSAITNILYPIPIDSVTSGFHFLDIEGEDTIPKARITVHYKDPDTIGNTVLYYWNQYHTRANFGWGGLSTNRYSPNTDDLVNGQYIRLTHANEFGINDSVDYYLVNVDREVFNFWDSFNKARNNEGPFATPVSLLTNIKGRDVTGCFSGFSISTQSLEIK